jgi:hypothetical protein
MTNPYAMQTIILASTVNVRLLDLQNPTCLRISQLYATMVLGVTVYQPLSAKTLLLFIHHMLSNKGLCHTHLLNFFSPKLHDSTVLIPLRTFGH